MQIRFLFLSFRLALRKILLSLGLAEGGAVHYISGSDTLPPPLPPEEERAAVEALNGPQEQVEEMRKAFEQRRNYMVARCNAIPGVSCLMPEGAFYIMMNISQVLGRSIGGEVIHVPQR